MIRFVNYFFSSILLLLILKCSYTSFITNRYKYIWNIGISTPKYFSITNCKVTFFCNGEYIQTAEANVDESWGVSTLNIINNDNIKSIPDSVSIKWFCNTDYNFYKGNFKLPREKILKSFEKDSIISFGEALRYSHIMVGAAPEGNVTIWLKGKYILTEISKFKADKENLSTESIKNIQDSLSKFNNSTKIINTELNIFHYLHGIPYSSWSKREEEFNYDFVCCNEENKQNYYIKVMGYSKDGSIIPGNLEDTEIKFVKWSNKFNIPIHNSKLHNKLPAHIFLKWGNDEREEVYQSEIVLPNNLEVNFKKTYINSNTKKKENYNRIIIGLEKQNNNIPYVFGRIWISGKDKQLEIMKFRAAKFNIKKNDFEVSKYSLPKGYVFPKWEGSEPLTKPTDFEYWQEK